MVSAPMLMTTLKRRFRRPSYDPAVRTRGALNNPGDRSAVGFGQTDDESERPEIVNLGSVHETYITNDVDTSLLTDRVNRGRPT